MVMLRFELAQKLACLAEPSTQVRAHLALELVRQHFYKADPEVSRATTEALCDSLPPGCEELEQRLERLGTHWALGIMFYAAPEADHAVIHRNFLRRCFAFLYELNLELWQRQLIVHQQLVDVVQDRCSGFFGLLGGITTLKGKTQPNDCAVFLQPVLLAGTIEPELRNALVRHYLRQLSSREREQFFSRARAGFARGFNHPWKPIFSEEHRERGDEVAIEEALPKSKPLEIGKLLERLEGLPLLEPGAQLGFLEGLTRNEHFCLSAEHFVNV